MSLCHAQNSGVYFLHSMIMMKIFVWVEQSVIDSVVPDPKEHCLNQTVLGSTLRPQYHKELNPDGLREVSHTEWSGIPNMPPAFRYFGHLLISCHFLNVGQPVAATGRSNLG